MYKKLLRAVRLINAEVRLKVFTFSLKIRSVSILIIILCIFQHSVNIPFFQRFLDAINLLSHEGYTQSTYLKTNLVVFE